MAKRTYGLGEEKGQRPIAAPQLPYQPRDPKRYRPAIALIGTGGITEQHLTAYRKAKYNVVALCALHDRAHAEQRRKQFFPQAEIFTDYHKLLERDDIEVVDVAARPEPRLRIIRDALNAKKHVLSQKPFVLDLDTGRKLVDLAEANGVKLAVNQNGRWAPHFSYMRQAIGRGLIGQIVSVHMSVHWNHDWIAGTGFNNMRHVVLYDFAIHWFDMLSVLMAGKPAKRVYATLTRSPSQKATPPLLGEAIVEYDGAQASLVFDAAAPFGPLDRTYVSGSKGSLSSVGPNLTQQTVTLYTARGTATPHLKGTWFPDGFHGTMGELLCAIEQNRQPSNSAQNNLASLALCFAAVKSADTGKPQIPGKVRRVAV